MEPEAYLPISHVVENRRPHLHLLLAVTPIQSPIQGLPDTHGSILREG